MQIYFTGKQELELRQSPASGKTIEADEIRIRSICSLMSTGTENIVYNRLFDEGTHWDNWVKYPFAPGYSLVGEVVEIGDAVHDYEIGSIVAARAHHTHEHILKDKDAIPVPQGIQPEDAAWFALAKITYIGALAANIQLDQRVVVIGGGPIGQMASRWALARGARRVALIDPVEKRLQIAKAGGVHIGINSPIQEAKELIENHLGSAPDVVIDSTGHATVFSEALKICKDFGTVIVLGDSGTPTQQYLTGDVINRGLHIVGAHDCHIRNQVPFECFFNLLQDQRITLEGMISHRFDVYDAKEAYSLVNRERGNTMGVLFTYKD